MLTLLNLEKRQYLLFTLLIIHRFKGYHCELGVGIFAWMSLEPTLIVHYSSLKTERVINRFKNY